MPALARLIGALSDARLERLLPPSSERALFAVMARRFDPLAADGFEGSVVYEVQRPLSGGAVGEHTIEIVGKRALAHDGAVEDPAVRLRISIADFIRVALGAIDPAEPILKGRATARGDIGVAARLPEMFRAARRVPR